MRSPSSKIILSIGSNLVVVFKVFMPSLNKVVPLFLYNFPNLFLLLNFEVYEIFFPQFRFQPNLSIAFAFLDVNMAGLIAFGRVKEEPVAILFVDLWHISAWLLINIPNSYSSRKLSTGLRVAARRVWALTESRARTSTAVPTSA